MVPDPGVLGAAGVEKEGEGTVENEAGAGSLNDAAADGSPPPAPGSGSSKGEAMTMMADGSLGGMMPNGQLAPVGTVDEDGELALVQGTQENLCRIGGSTLVNVSGRIALFKENQAEPDAFHPGPLRLRIYYRKEPGTRLLAYEETGFLDEAESAFWRVQASVVTADPESLRFTVFDTLKNRVYALPSYLESVPGPSPLPKCYKATQKKGPTSTTLVEP